MPAVSSATLMLVGIGLCNCLLLLAAMWIDKSKGEPRAAYHPVVWMGHYLALCGRLTVKLPPAPAFVLGAVFWLMGVVITGLLAWAVQAAFFWQLGKLLLPAGLQGMGGTGILFTLSLFLLLAWLLKCMLSWRMLHDEAGAVEAALEQSLAAGQQRLAMLVSRDTASLTETEVRESAIESLAENLSDSVVAPVFWFVLFGLPGAAIYRFANTADAMWGYRGMRKGVNWEWAGKWAAHADDVLSWWPARLTALMLKIGRSFSLSKLQAEAVRTPSPNSGWPMAAMALALGVSLKKQGVYVLNEKGRAAMPFDTVLARKYASKVLGSAILCAMPAIVLVAIAKFS